MEFRVLGPLEVRDSRGAVPLGGPKQRAVLALLLLHHDEVVPAVRLVDELWGASVPRTSPTALQNYVSRLRKVVGSDALLWDGSGYRLHVDAERTDLARFERLLARARERLSVGETESAAADLRSALALWRGPALADVDFEGTARAEVARLDELRATALEERVDADLALGNHAALVAELEALVGEYPLRERLRGQLMTALYRCGRQAEALQVYQRTRRELLDELGIDPSPNLQRLERAILRQDPELELTAPIPAERRPEARSGPGTPVDELHTRQLQGSRHMSLIAAVCALGLALAVAAGMTLAKAGGDGIAVAPNSVAVIDAKSNRVVSDVAVGIHPSTIAVGEGAVWVGNAVDHTISRIDPQTRTVIRTIPVGEASLPSVAAGEHSVWVTSATGRVLRIDPVRNEVDRSATIGRWNAVSPPSTPETLPVAVGKRAVWIGDRVGIVSRIDPVTMNVLARVDVRTAVSAIAIGDDSIWVAQAHQNTVRRVGAEAPVVTGAFTVGASPSAIVVGEGAVWVAGRADDLVTRIDPFTKATRTIAVGDEPVALAIGSGSVWVANSRSYSVSRIDPTAGAIVGTITLPAAPTALAFRAGEVWVSVAASAP